MAIPTTTVRRALSSAPRTTRARLAPRLVAAGATSLALAVVAACGSASEPPIPAPVTVTPTIEPARGTPPEPDVPVVWPLTGVEVDEVPARPALSVKVENSTSARPQTGLDQADVVWETIVEFEVSRLVAVYHSQVPTEVGPIRSVRPMDPLIVAPLGGLLAYSGGQPGILAEVRSSGVQSLSHDDGAAGMYRVSSRRAPHNVYASPEALWAQARGDSAAPPAEQFEFARTAAQATAVVDGTKRSNLSLRLSGQSRPSWTWDGDRKEWLRSESGVRATTPAGTQLGATNVVVITASHPATRYKAQGGAKVPTYTLVEKGPALVATRGRTIEGTWVKTGADKPLRLKDKNGDPLLLAPGSTWVELVPKGSGSYTVG